METKLQRGNTRPRAVSHPPVLYRQLSTSKEDCLYNLEGDPILSQRVAKMVMAEHKLYEPLVAEVAKAVISLSLKPSQDEELPISASS